MLRVHDRLTNVTTFLPHVDAALVATIHLPHRSPPAPVVWPIAKSPELRRAVAAHQIATLAELVALDNSNFAYDEARHAPSPAAAHAHIEATKRALDAAARVTARAREQIRKARDGYNAQRRVAKPAPRATVRVSACSQARVTGARQSRRVVKTKACAASSSDPESSSDADSRLTLGAGVSR